MINLAIIGLGNWARTLVRAVSNSDAVCINHACVRDPLKYKTVLEELAIQHLSFEQALDHPKIDGIVIATPHSVHFNQARTALLSGKHVFCEKPLALIEAEAVQLYDLATEKNLILAVGYNRRFLPAIQHLASMIRAGDLGQLINMEGNFSGAFGFGYDKKAWRTDDKNAPAGGLTAMAIHLIDLFTFLNGEIDTVNAQSFRQIRDMPLDDTVNLTLQFKNGVPGYITSMMATPWTWRLQVFGTKGWVSMTSDNELEYRKVWKSDDRYVERPSEFIEFDPANTERLELEAFSKAILQGVPYPISSEGVISGTRILEKAILQTTG